MDRRNFLVDSLLAVSGAALVNRTHSLEQLLRAKGPITTGVWVGLNRADYVGWEFYECGGQILWPIYACNGALSSSYMAWLIHRATRTALPLRFSMEEVEGCASQPELLDDMVRLKIVKATERGAIKCDFDGGELPMVLENES